MQKHSKKPKPIDEMTIDVKSAKNIAERTREKIATPMAMDDRAILDKEYSRSRNNLQQIDDAWVRLAIKRQTHALNELKVLDPNLYAQAIQPTDKSVVLQGPAVTPPVKEYQSPDGDYLDTTRTWT